MQASQIGKQTKVVFEALMDHRADFLSFSQRKFIGFRGKYEFDQKRVLIASDDKITLLGIHPHSERPFEILNSPIPGLNCSPLASNDNLSDNTQSINNESQSEVAGPLADASSATAQEEVLDISFILDRIPSYLLVISRTKNLDPSSADGGEAPNKEGGLTFRILSLSMMASDTQSQSRTSSPEKVFNT